MRRESMEFDKWIRERCIQDVLVNGNYRDSTCTISIRIISWVIYYGHGQILQYLLKQIDLHKETLSVLCSNSFNPHLSNVMNNGEKNISTNTLIDNSWQFRSGIKQRHGTNEDNSEQQRLLLLSCYGGDYKTLKILIEYLKRNAKNVASKYLHFNDMFQDTSLIAACEGGHLNIVKELIEAGADVNLQGKYYTPLKAACKFGHLNIVKELLEAKADVNLKDAFDSPLTTACNGGNNSIVKELLKAGADVNLQDKCECPLTVACGGGYMDVVEDLLKAGADVNLQGKYKSPLTAACQDGQISAVKELIESGADVNLKGVFDTPLTAACGGGYIDVVKELLNAGADVNLQSTIDDPLTDSSTGGYANVVKELIEPGADVYPQREYINALAAACEGGHLSVVKELLKAGANVNLRGQCKSPLIVACGGGYSDVVKELIKAGADVNLQAKHKSPLSVACRGGYIDIVKDLLKAGADVNLQSGCDSPLTVACGGGYINIVKELIESGADINPQGEKSSPLTAACKHGHSSVVTELIGSGADVNLIVGFDTPMTAACGGGYINIVQELLMAGANVNQKAKADTPLTSACKNKRMNIAKELLDAGSSVNLQDEEGRTPLFTVVLKINKIYIHLVIRMLKRYGADTTIRNKDGISAYYYALVRNKTSDMQELLRADDDSQLARLKLHSFDCLVNIRHSDVMTDSKDDVVVTRRLVWRMERWGDLYLAIIKSDCKGLKHLLCVGLDVNQWIQLYNDSNDESDSKPLLFTLIDEDYLDDTLMDKVRILLESGVDVNVRVRYREYDSLLDREGVSVLERTRRMVSECSKDEWKRVELFNYTGVIKEVKKHVRRYSV